MRPRKTKRVICRSEELASIRPPRECVGRGGHAPGAGRAAAGGPRRRRIDGRRRVVAVGGNRSEIAVVVDVVGTAAIGARGRSSGCSCTSLNWRPSSSCAATSGTRARCCRLVARRVLGRVGVARIGAGMSAAPAMTRQNAGRRAVMARGSEPIGFPRTPRHRAGQIRRFSAVGPRLALGPVEHRSRDAFDVLSAVGKVRLSMTRAAACCTRSSLKTIGPASIMPCSMSSGGRRVFQISSATAGF
jgi:hypothetical protein